uniref:Uncharacterized protein n=1 Tax=Anguilla anguilla TaxID=7936 RepID=A0A0E9T6V3_ANGAN
MSEHGFEPKPWPQAGTSWSTCQLPLQHRIGWNRSPHFVKHSWFYQ